MSTRRLILAALLCGLAILVAGGVQLLRLSDSEETVELLPVGQEALVGDMQVIVLGSNADEGADELVVTVEVGGVDGEPVGEGWRMLADGVLTEPTAVRSIDDRPCGVTSAAERTQCALVFDRPDGTAVVSYGRGGEQVQWRLTDT